MKLGQGIVKIMNISSPDYFLDGVRQVHVRMSEFPTPGVLYKQVVKMVFCVSKWRR